MKVYVINLDRHVGRLAWIKQVFADAGVPFQRIRAVDADRLNDAFIDQFGLNSGVFKLSRFEVALMMGNRKIWRRHLQSGDEYCAVCEDDIHLGAGFRQVLEALESSNARFDVVKIETVLASTRIALPRIRCADGQLAPLLDRHLGAGAYVINRKAAKTLLRVSRAMPAPIDLLLFDTKYMKSNGLRVMQLVPAVAGQDCILNPQNQDVTLRSTITERADVRGAKLKGWKKTVREIGRVAEQAYRAIRYGKLVRGVIHFE